MYFGVLPQMKKTLLLLLLAGNFNFVFLQVVVIIEIEFCCKFVGFFGVIVRILQV